MFITLDQLKRSLVAIKEYISTTKGQLQALIPTKMSQLQNDSGYSITPDWDQNASTQNDYIKNRICYFKDPTDVMICGVGINAGVDHEYINANTSVIRFFQDETITYSITFDGTEYTGNIDYIGTHPYLPCFGNYHIHNQFSDDTGEPFFGIIIDEYTIELFLSEATSKLTHFMMTIKNYQVAQTLNDKLLDGALLGVGFADNARTVNESAEALGEGSVGENSGSAYGWYSHAEGYRSEAYGAFSHTEGNQTIARHSSQHVFGEYNIEDNSTSSSGERGNYIEIVGNGTDSSRSNARTLDWSGNEVLAGKLTVGAAPTANMDVATKKYVDDAVAGGSAGSAVTYTLSMTNNIITLTGSDGSTSSVTLPVYDGAFSVVGEGASF